MAGTRAYDEDAGGYVEEASMGEIFPVLGAPLLKVCCGVPIFSVGDSFKIEVDSYIVWFKI